MQDFRKMKEIGRFIAVSTFSTSTRISVLLALAAFLLLMLPLDARAKVPLARQPKLSATLPSKQLLAAPPLLLGQYQLFEAINREDPEQNLRRAAFQQNEGNSVAQAVGIHLGLGTIIFGNTKEVDSALGLDLKLLEMSKGESMPHREGGVLGDFALCRSEDVEKRRPETYDQYAANFCHKCGAKLPPGSVFCPSCGTKVITTPGEYTAADKYDVAYELYQKRKFDDVISELEAFCADHPNNVKANFLLAKAYLEKSHSLKESGEKGWKPILLKAYNIGLRFSVTERYNPELIYIFGKSFYINNRREKAVRYGKKAIKLSGYNLEYSEYFLLVGDAYSSLAGPSDSSVTSTPAENNDTLAVKYYNYVINGFKGANANDSSRALAYYRLAVHYSESGGKRRAKESLEAALQLSSEKSLSSQIHVLLNKL